MSARIIAVANQKGGVGKTTTALAVGAALAERGQRVLLVDLDPQASLTSAAGVELAADAATVYTALAAFASAGELPHMGTLLQTLTVQMDLLPASIELAAAEMELLSAVRREYILGEVLASIQDGYDVAFIDCPPSLSLLTLNALTAADEVLVPVVPDYLAARGLGLLLDSIERIRKTKLNPRLVVGGIVLTMVDFRTAHNREVAESIRAHLDNRIPILGEVKRSTKTAEAAAAGLPVTVYAPRTDAAIAYGEIAATLVGRWGMLTAPAAPVSHHSTAEEAAHG